MGFGFCEFCPPDFHCHIVPTIQKLFHYGNFHKSGFSTPLYQSHHKNKKARENPRFYSKKICQSLFNNNLGTYFGPIIEINYILIDEANASR